jgi:hypothetical protein
MSFSRRLMGNGPSTPATVFARKVVLDCGVVADADVEQLRAASYTDGEVGEIVANLALNVFSNYFNHVAATELDFPAATGLAAWSRSAAPGWSH